MCRLLPLLSLLAIGVPGCSFRGGEQAVEPLMLELAFSASSTNLTDRITLGVAPANDPRVQAVEYFINGRSISHRVASATFRFGWDTWFFWDGWAWFEAAAYDADGEVVGRAAPVLARINNREFELLDVILTREDGTREELTDFARSARLSGSVRIEARGAARFPALAAGEVSLRWYLNDTLLPGGRLDTRRFANGRYALRAVAVDERTRVNDHPTNQMFGEVNLTVDIANPDATPHHLAPDWAQLVLQPGQTERVSARQLDTTGAAIAPPRTVTFQSADTAVASVDDNGLVTARQPGATRVTLADGETTNEVAVFVFPTGRGFPHFGRGGERRNTYDPARSILPRSCFYLSAAECEREPGLLPFVRDAAINALEEGAYVNPSYFIEKGEIEKWREYVLGQRWEKARLFAEREDFSVISIGDEIARLKQYLTGFYDIAWSRAALQEFSAALAASGRVVALEMVDEATMVLGATPFEDSPHWAKLGVRPTMVGDLVDTWRSVSNSVPLGWPIFGLHGADIAGKWTHPRYADYISLYWTWAGWVMDPFEHALDETRREIDQATLGRYGAIQMDRPVMLDYSICGPWYRKEGPGPVDPRRGDRIANNASAPQGGRADWVSLQIGAMVARGAAALRAYSFHWHGWQRAEAEAGLPQYGAHPFRTGSHRWAALTAANQAIAQLTGHILQPEASARFVHPDVMTAARRGSDHGLFMAVGFNEAPVEIEVDLTPYRLDAAGDILRLHVRGGNLDTVRLKGRDRDRLTLQPRETVYWAFGRAGANGPSVRFATRDVRTRGPVTLRATVDAPRAVQRVEFYIGAQLMGVATTAPYECRWSAEQAPHRDVWLSARAVAVGVNGRTSEARTMVRFDSATE
jgi:hypothetical protein